MSGVAIVEMLLACCTAFLPAQNSPNPQPLSSSLAAPAQPLHVPGSEMLGLVDKKVMPQYPREAMTRGIEGDVIFEIGVDETGKLFSIRPLQGTPQLLSAAQEALSQYHFRPYIVHGTPVEVESRIGFQFRLTKERDSTEGQVECITSLP